MRRTMQYKISFTKGPVHTKALVEAPTLIEAMKRGFREHGWDSVLEVTTADDKPVQPVATA